jgi:hypothetical protein
LDNDRARLFAFIQGVNLALWQALFQFEVRRHDAPSIQRDNFPNLEEVSPQSPRLPLLGNLGSKTKTPFNLEEVAESW